VSYTWSTVILYHDRISFYLQPTCVCPTCVCSNAGELLRFHVIHLLFGYRRLSCRSFSTGNASH